MTLEEILARFTAHPETQFVIKELMAAKAEITLLKQRVDMLDNYGQGD
jgi:hypothetical protein